MPVYRIDESSNPLLDESGAPIPMLDESGNILYQTESVPVYRTDYAADIGQTTETYTYDGLNRLATVVRDGTSLGTLKLLMHSKPLRRVRETPADRAA